jgi:hypothetical protein
MLRLLSFLIKLSIFGVVILMLGHVVTWKGKTISDQVKTQMSHAERMDLVGQVKTWTNDTLSSEASPRAKQKKDEQISPTERQKLKALIQELNGRR